MLHVHFTQFEAVQIYVIIRVAVKTDSGGPFIKLLKTVCC